MANIVLDYTPRTWQLLVHHKLKRFNVVVVHRGGGKTVFCANEMVRKATQTPKGVYGYVAPQRDQAKKVFWRLIKDATRPLGKVDYNEQDLKCTLPNGAVIYVMGADNPDSLRGNHWDGLIIDETQDINPIVWDILEPATENRKAWVIFIGTPKGHNFFYKMFQIATDPKNANAWYGVKLDIHQTKIYSPSEIEDMRQRSIARNGDDVFFRQEMMCDFEGAILGAYYVKQLQKLQEENKITSVPYDPRFPVNTAWDLGMSDATAIWFFQLVGNEVRIIDYEEGSGIGLPEWASILQRRGYHYGSHIAPHDISVREIGSGMSRIETAYSLGINFDIIAPKLKTMEGINAVRMLLPRCAFDKEKANKRLNNGDVVGLESLFQYAPKKDREGNPTGEPAHNKYSHGADAFRYLALCVDDIRNRSNPSYNHSRVYQSQAWNPYDITF
jgi:hypothetical protein